MAGFLIARRATQKLLLPVNCLLDGEAYRNIFFWFVDFSSFKKLPEAIAKPVSADELYNALISILPNGAKDHIKTIVIDCSRPKNNHLKIYGLVKVGFVGEWEVKRLKDLFRFSGGYSASREQLSTEGHCYLRYGDIHGSSKTSIDTKVDYQNIPKLDIPLKSISSDSLLEDGIVVFVDATDMSGELLAIDYLTDCPLSITLLPCIS